MLISQTQKPFYLSLRGIRTKAELLDFYNQQLKCPYFGYNWDVLKDCLIGLREWIPKKKMHLFIGI
ncbi:barstar family protein [Bacteroides pyogenes]|uniref:barstar family protein n=1 Tax=Bacteroides pyogenes TaxID=310300 RepID=UPI003A522294